MLAGSHLREVEAERVTLRDVDRVADVLAECETEVDRDDDLLPAMTTADFVLETDREGDIDGEADREALTSPRDRDSD